MEESLNISLNETALLTSHPDKSSSRLILLKIFVKSVTLSTHHVPIGDPYSRATSLVVFEGFVANNGSTELRIILKAALTVTEVEKRDEKGEKVVLPDEHGR
jgi:hypothetical protein